MVTLMFLKSTMNRFLKSFMMFDSGIL